MKKSLLILSVVLSTFSAPLAFASTLTVTCGKNAYEALEEKNTDKAEFSAVIKLKGKNNPPELIGLADSGDLTDSANITTYSLEDGAYGIGVSIGGGMSYSINVKGCHDLDESEGSVVQLKRNRPGSYVPHSKVGEAKCNCVKQ